MFRPRARVGCSRSVVPLPGRLLGLLLALLLLACAGCGSDSSQKSKPPSKAALACRADWKDLRADVEGRSSRTNPSALAPRWNAMAATAAYYATSASGGDCGKTMDDQRKAMVVLTSFSTKLAPYDMEKRLTEVKADAEKYAAGPRPPAPKPSPTPKAKAGKKGAGKLVKRKPAPLPPKPADIGAALKTLTTQAPVATQQQGPGWEQARVADLSDAAAVAKTVKDLAFLSSESPAYRACTAALAQITAAQAAAGG